MDIYYSKCSMFTNKNGITIKCEIDAQLNLYCYCIDCGFKNFETIDEAERCRLYIKQSHCNLGLKALSHKSLGLGDILF